ncbi:hypothetical protein [Methylocapsa aurea]|uniref:hypothetical protein n=1 Tax=Methylocapsa aurea TaxID=663610 RepID=UPI000AC6FEA0|nr:hypothetical protein [Methylocapsa aurea]
MTVVRLEKTKPPRRAPRREASPSRASRRGRRRHVAAAIGVLCVALVLVGLSLSHLAAGVALVTGSGERDGWLMAIGIDVGFVVLELAMLVSPAAIRPAAARYAAPAIIGTLAISAGMNALAFAAHAEGWLLYPAIGLGVAVPALIYALTKTGAVLLFQNPEKSNVKV